MSRDLEEIGDYQLETVYSYFFASDVRQSRGKIEKFPLLCHCEERSDVAISTLCHSELAWQSHKKKI